MSNKLVTPVSTTVEEVKINDTLLGDYTVPQAGLSLTESVADALVAKYPDLLKSATADPAVVRGFRAIISTGSVAAAGTYKCTFRTPENTIVKLKPLALSSIGNSLQVALNEASTVSVDGTEVTPIQDDRNAGDSPTVSVFKGSTVTDAGTEIDFGQRASGGDSMVNPTAPEEFSLKEDTDYTIVMTNNGDTDATVGTLVITWDEMVYAA